MGFDDCFASVTGNGTNFRSCASVAIHGNLAVVVVVVPRHQQPAGCLPWLSLARKGLSAARPFSCGGGWTQPWLGVSGWSRCLLNLSQMVLWGACPRRSLSRKGRVGCGGVVPLLSAGCLPWFSLARKGLTGGSRVVLLAEDGYGSP